MTTGLFWDARILWHDPGPTAHVLPAGGLVQPGIPVDSPDRVHRVHSLVEASGLIDQLRVIRSRPATEDELVRFHTRAYVERVRELSAIGIGDAGWLAPVTADTFDLACLSAGACLQAVEMVIDGDIDNAYVIPRPAGHHARPDGGLGSCIFGYEALAALHARATRGVRRIAAIDWDAHHGNSVQLAFWDDPDVLTISLHQDSGFPPGSGPAEEVGGPGAEGSNINIPLPPGSGEGAYYDAFDRVVIPALQDFGAELVIVASGYDSAVMDPNGRMMLRGDSYRRMMRSVMDTADATCGGRVVVIHEGGYNTGHTPFTALAVIETLAGTPPTDDPFAMVGDNPWQALQPHQRDVIDNVLELQTKARSVDSGK